MSSLIIAAAGAGKTTLSTILKSNYSSFIIDADEVARKLSNDSKTKYFEKMVNLFGKEILKDDGKLNRKEIARTIYKNKEKRSERVDVEFRGCYGTKDKSSVIEKYIKGYRKLKHWDSILNSL